MTVGGAFVYVCEIEQQSRLYNAVRYNAFFPVDPDDRVLMELQCNIYFGVHNRSQWLQLGK